MADGRCGAGGVYTQDCELNSLRYNSVSVLGGFGAHRRRQFGLASGVRLDAMPVSSLAQTCMFHSATPFVHVACPGRSKRVQAPQGLRRVLSVPQTSSPAPPRPHAPRASRSPLSAESGRYGGISYWLLCTNERKKKKNANHHH